MLRLDGLPVCRLAAIFLLQAGLVHSAFSMPQEESSPAEKAIGIRQVNEALDAVAA